LKKSVLRNENTISDKTSKNKALQISSSCDFNYIHSNHKKLPHGKANIAKAIEDGKKKKSNTIERGTLNIKCKGIIYPIKLGKLLSFKDGLLQVNSLGEGNVVHNCDDCEVLKETDSNGKLQFSFFCGKFRNQVGSRHYFEDLKIDLRPILNNYLDY